MAKKIRELKKMLQKAGFEQEPKRGKGSHTVVAIANPNLAFFCKRYILVTRQILNK